MKRIYRVTFLVSVHTSRFTNTTVHSKNAYGKGQIEKILVDTTVEKLSKIDKGGIKDLKIIYIERESALQYVNRIIWKLFAKVLKRLT